MSFELRHTLVSKRFTPKRHSLGEHAFFKVSEQGEFPVLFPGRLNRGASATFTHRMRVDSVEGETPRHGGFQTVHKTIRLTLRLFTPEGREFNGNEITLADLRQFRNLRGGPSGPWTYQLTGESEHIFVDEDSSITNAKGTVGLTVLETIPSESAPPLIANAPITPLLPAFQFDLFRVGTFVAEITHLAIGTSWRGSMRLVDPDGVVVAQTVKRRLVFDVGLPTLGKSRDAAGKVREWTLEVLPKRGTIIGIPRVNATVIGKRRMTIPALRSRIDALLGPHGSFIELFGENQGGNVLARLKVTDIVSAEAIDMHGLLETTLSRVKQNAGADPKNFQPNTVYTLASTSASLDAGLKLEVKMLRVETIDVAIGPGVMLGASVPTVRLTVAVSGAVKVKFKGLTLAEAKVRDGKFDFEVGITLSPDGTPQVVTAVPDSPFDIDISAPVRAALIATLGIVGGLIGGMSIEDYVEDRVNQKVCDGAKKLFADPVIAPSILMMIFGAHLTYKPFRFEGDAIVFDHIAPVEPDPKPTPGYHGAIGRRLRETSPHTVTFTPPLLGDTWRSDNLSSKIDHIVVVMMENRSYDHVLGYRAQSSTSEGGNGLTDAMIAAIESAPGGPSVQSSMSDGGDGLTDAMIAAIESAPGGPFNVRRLRDAKFDKNSLGKMTRLPKGVGHEVHDVEQQLSERTAGPDERIINSPKGFVENFKPRLTLAPNEPPHNVEPDDVLGFYDAQDLPFYAYLAENYAYCDRYFCSHPGPTLPNRMYSLTGDVQRDRYGFPILDNNNSDNFLLSRAPTIYDFLARKGLGFRVYESEPSVTMLRMFARYATDTVNIVPRYEIDPIENVWCDRLKGDVLRGDLPALTVVEPQMHAHPQDDDHPDADMHRGQIFVKGVYDALRSNPKLWERTLLIITYDEHGGLFDHVVPPVADVYYAPAEPVLDHNSGDPMPGTAVLSFVGTSPTRGGVAGTIGSTVRDRVPVHENVPSPAVAPAPLLLIPYGVRVPTFVVSPWTMRGKGPNLTLDHCSIVKTVLARFLGKEKPFISDRVSASHSFDAFLTEPVARMDVPDFSGELLELPFAVRSAPWRTSSIVTRPLSRKELREKSVDYHEFTGRWARQLGR